MRIAALGLLAQHPGSGYDLLRRFEKSMANVWPATQSQLYGELNKLADAGLIEVTDVGARGRKEYAVTAAGRAELVRWVSSPQDDPPVRSAALLRIFLLAEIPADEARHHLLALADHSRAEHARLAALRDSTSWNGPGRGEGAAFFSRAALEYGLRLRAMEIQWADDVLATLPNVASR